PSPTSSSRRNTVHPTARHCNSARSRSATPRKLAKNPTAHPSHHLKTVSDTKRPDGSETIQPRHKEERRKLRLWVRVVTTALSAGLAFACSDPGYDSPSGGDAFAENESGQASASAPAA